MWHYIKEKQPIAGSEIEILAKAAINECTAAHGTVFIHETKQILRFEDFDFWREKETETKTS